MDQSPVCQINQMGQQISRRSRPERCGRVGIDAGSQVDQPPGAGLKGGKDQRLALFTVQKQRAAAGVQVGNRCAMSGQGQRLFPGQQPVQRRAVLGHVAVWR